MSKQENKSTVKRTYFVYDGIDNTSTPEVVGYTKCTNFITRCE
jgi:hypothetical protein